MLRDRARQPADLAASRPASKTQKKFPRESNPSGNLPRMLIDNLIRTDRKRTDDISRGEARRKS